MADVVKRQENDVKNHELTEVQAPIMQSICRPIYQQFCLILGVEERTSYLLMLSALAQAEILSILSRYLYFYLHFVLLICDFSYLNLPGMVLQGVRRL